MTSLFVTQIWQKNNHAFSIRWNDGIVQDFKLCDLQRNCPCANCADEITGSRLLDPQTVSDNVRAIVIRSVGRYGLRIQFASGCSTGIYSFDRLRKMEQGKVC
jgi:DUF971 family protein